LRNISLVLLASSAISFAFLATNQVVIGPCADLPGFLCLLSLFIGTPLGFLLFLISLAKSRKKMRDASLPTS